MQYDAVLKELFQHAPQRLLEQLVGTHAHELLTVEYPSVQLRKPDLVARLTDGALFHLELQSRADREMLWRMLEYYIALYRHFQQTPVQRVLYVGASPWQMTETLEHPNLSYHCPFIDIQQLDGQALLDSPQIEDRLFAVLCRMDNPQGTIRTLLESIQSLPDKARHDALEKLLVLSGLRKLEAVLKQEVNTMALVVDIRQNEFFRDAWQEGLKEGMEAGMQQGMEAGMQQGMKAGMQQGMKAGMQQGMKAGMQQGMEEGHQEGERSILLRLLTLRFGELPPERVAQIQHGNREQLCRWGERLLFAESLDAVFE